jgi:hypothetical protein
VLVGPYRIQTREHVFKNCPGWKTQEKILWAEVRKESGRGKDQFKIRDLFTNTRCSQLVLDFLSTTDVGRRGPSPAEDDAQSEASEWKLRERSEKREARRREAEELGIEDEERPLCLPTPSCRRGVGGAGAKRGRWGFLRLSFVISFVISLVRSISLGTGLGGGQRGACDEVRTADRKRTVCISREQ